MNKKIFIILLIIFLVVPAAGANAARELNGDKLDLQQTENGQIITALGNVELIYDELRITADDEAIYRRFNGEIEFRKNVEFFYQEYQGQAVELTGNLEEEIIHLIGEAVITSPTSRLEGDEISVFQAEDRIEVKGNAYLEYNDFWAEADQLTYYLDREFMHLEGNVKGERNGESFEAQAAEIDQKAEEVKLQGQAKVTLPKEEVSAANSDQNSEAAENDN
jgi:lipopolysaccharide export system protein LptA